MRCSVGFFILVIICAAITLIRSEYVIESTNTIVTNRIYNGVIIRDINNIKWLVALYIYTKHGLFFCGGTVVSEKAILTAASCANLPDIIYMTAIFGVTNLRRVYSDNYLKRIIVPTSDNILIAPTYRKFVHDVAILLLDKCITSNLLNRYLKSNLLKKLVKLMKKLFRVSKSLIDVFCFMLNTILFGAKLKVNPNENIINKDRAIPADGQNVLVVGHGDIAITDPLTDAQLTNLHGFNFNRSAPVNDARVATVQVISFEDCRKFYQILGLEISKEDHICTKSINNEAGACWGDIGTPLVLNLGVHSTLVGIATTFFTEEKVNGLAIKKLIAAQLQHSTGPCLNGPIFPNVFVRLSSTILIDWIAKSIANTPIQCRLCKPPLNQTVLRIQSL